MGRDGLWSDVAGDPDLPVAVVVHGSMDRSAGLLRLSRRLDGHFHVIRYDRRGYGRSLVPGQGGVGVVQHVDDLAGVIAERASTRRASLVFGHSFGGNVALGLADRRPELVDAVAVFETPLSWLDWWPGTTSGGAALATPDPEDAAEAFMRRLVGDATWDRLPSSKQAERRAEGPAMLAELDDLRRAEPWRADRIGAPVLAMFGELGRLHHRRGMEYVAQRLPDASLEMISGVGHAAPHTHADAVAERLLRFAGSERDRSRR